MGPGYSVTGVYLDFIVQVGAAGGSRAACSRPARKSNGNSDPPRMSLAGVEVAQP